MFLAVVHPPIGPLNGRMLVSNFYFYKHTLSGFIGMGTALVDGFLFKIRRARCFIGRGVVDAMCHSEEIWGLSEKFISWLTLTPRSTFEYPKCHLSIDFLDIIIKFATSFPCVATKDAFSMAETGVT